MTWVSIKERKPKQSGCYFWKGKGRYGGFDFYHIDFGFQFDENITYNKIGGEDYLCWLDEDSDPLSDENRQTEQSFNLPEIIAMQLDHLSDENRQTEQSFNLPEIIAMQLDHDIQIIRGEDYQYMCYIDGKVYATALTPMYALAYGIKVFKERSKNNNICQD